MSENLKSSDIKTEIIKAIEVSGPITFDRFMEICLYSPQNGFYSTRDHPINKNFSTSSHVHDVFGGLLAVQLEEMWRCLEKPREFYLLEIGCGDGSLARSIQRTIQISFPEFSKSLIHIAADLSPVFTETSVLRNRIEPSRETSLYDNIQKVVADGVKGFRDITGCIFSNELIDNFPVHRFTKIDGSIQEIFTDFDGDRFYDILGNPSTPAIPRRLKKFEGFLPNGFRGEINLRIDPWIENLADTLTKGFILTIDYGESREQIYSSEFPNGTLTCFRQHLVNHEPYLFLGQQDITSHVDFTSLTNSGKKNGLTSLGYLSQKEFLTNLGFNNFLEELLTPLDGLSEAQIELRRIAMTSLVDPLQMGNFKVLIQCKNINYHASLTGLMDKHS